MPKRRYGRLPSGTGCTSRGAAASSQTTNPSRIGGKKDGQYATIGETSGEPAAGSACISTGYGNKSIMVIHPDESYTAARDWWRY